MNNVDEKLTHLEQMFAAVQAESRRYRGATTTLGALCVALLLGTVGGYWFSVASRADWQRRAAALKTILESMDRRTAAMEARVAAPSYGRTETFETVHARELSIVDDEGRLVWAMSTMNGDGFLAMFSTNGQPLITLAAAEGHDGVVFLNNADGENRVVLGASTPVARS